MSELVPDQTEAPSYPVRSVAKALEMLLLLRDREQIGVSEASRELGIARSTAHRLVSMLVHYGFARRDVEARYVHGPALVSLGLAAVMQMDVRRRARPFMDALAREVEETVTLIGLEGTNVRCLDCAESPRTIRVAARTGLVRPSHCTSAGKAMLAELPHGELERLYPNEDLPGLTDRSLRTRRELFTELEAVREKGYATNLGESDADLRAVGVAIPGVAERPYAGLGISAPAERLTQNEIELVAKAAMFTAQQIVESDHGPTRG